MPAAAWSRISACPQARRPPGAGGTRPGIAKPRREGILWCGGGSQEMTEGAMRAKIVHIRREQGEGGWFYATSPDMNGLLVAQPRLDDLDRAIPAAIAALYAACNMDVIVTRAKDEDHHRGWVALPAALAREALAQKGCDRTA